MSETLYVASAKYMLVIHVTLCENVFLKKCRCLQKVHKWHFLLFFTQYTQHVFANTMCQDRNLGCQEKISLLTIVSCSPKSLMKCALIVTLKVSKQPWRRFQVLSFLFEEFQSILQDEEENPMRAYWMAFLDMTQVLLDYAKFICIGNWELSGCFWTYAFIVSCLWPPKLIAIFPAIGVGRSWSKTSILQSTKLSSRKISQQKERLESLICYRWTRLSSKRSINNKKGQKA